MSRLVAQVRFAVVCGFAALTCPLAWSGDKPPAARPMDTVTLVRTVRPSVVRVRPAFTFKGKAEKVLFLKADEALEYGDVLRVMDLCRDAGADEIGLITEVKTRS